MMKMVDDKNVKKLDIFNMIYCLRKERRYMVQTLSQYTYVYKCVLEYLNRRKLKGPSESESIIYQY